MSYVKTKFGTTLEGTIVHRYTLMNTNGVSASFTDFGAIWLTMMVPDRDGKMDDVILGYDTVAAIQSEPGHMGEPIGRNANRIGNAKFTLNGVTYELAVNNAGKHNIHSGLDFYRDRVWNTVVEDTEEGIRITFSLHSPDGDQGFPGNADIKVSYTLEDDNSLKLDYYMVADADTVANFTNHVYFNLNGHNSGNVLSQKVWIDADTFTIADDTSIPTGELVLVAGTPMDFTVMKPIGQDIQEDYEPLKFAKGYDHNWVLNHPERKFTLSAKAEADESGRTMEVYTDLPGIQFYTSNSLLSDKGKDGTAYRPRQGFCFETQYFPDAINKPQFASPVLKAGEIYRTSTVYKFGVKW